LERELLFVLERELLFVLERELLFVLTNKRKRSGVFMVSLFYKDHTIVNTGRPAGSVEDPVGFLPIAVISWDIPDQSRRGMHILKSRGLYRTAGEASAAALEEAKLLVDRHL
jgi:hypothetical protein